MLKSVELEPFHLGPHDDHDRFYRVSLDPERIKEFIRVTKDVDGSTLEGIPYMRFIMAKEFVEIFGSNLKKSIGDILRDRSAGAMMCQIEVEMSADEHLKLATAIGHLLGPSSLDILTGSYYSRLTYRYNGRVPEAPGRSAYHTETLHTDGAFDADAADWVFLLKTAAQPNLPVGVEWRFLHIDDWESLEEFSEHPLASKEFYYRIQTKEAGLRTTRKKTFLETSVGLSLFFIDHLVYPDTIAEAVYLKNLSEALEKSNAVATVPCPPGSFLMFNNRFWLHGRQKPPAPPPEGSFTELLRICGLFDRVR